MILRAAAARAPPRGRRTARAPTCRCRRGRRARRCRSRGRAAGRSRGAARRERPCRPKTSRSPRTSLQLAVADDAAERRAALGVDDEARVHRQVLRPSASDMRLVSRRGRPCRSPETSISAMPGPAGVDGELGAVLLGVEADRGRLHAQRQVLRDDRHVEAVVGEVHRARRGCGSRCRRAAGRTAAPTGSSG